MQKIGSRGSHNESVSSESPNIKHSLTYSLPDINRLQNWSKPLCVSSSSNLQNILILISFNAVHRKKKWRRSSIPLLHKGQLKVGVPICGPNRNWWFPFYMIEHNKKKSNSKVWVAHLQLFLFYQVKVKHSRSFAFSQNSSIRLTLFASIVVSNGSLYFSQYSCEVSGENYV